MFQPQDKIRSKPAGPAVGSQGWLRDALGGFIGLAGFGSRGGCLIRRANILRPGFGEDVLGRGDVFLVFGVHRDKKIAFIDFAFVALGFDLRNAQADQPAGNPARSRADGRSA